jgi:hypothetical protein
MCDVIWDALAMAGIIRNDPTTWTKTRPEHLQHLKAHPVFQAIGTDRTIEAIRQVLAGQALPMPKNWGAFFLHFPTGGEWQVPATGWHMDGDYTGQLSPPCGVLIHAMLTDVGPRCGGTNILSGSHRLVHKWFTEHAPAPATRSALLRKSLQRHPYLRDLCTCRRAGKSYRALSRQRRGSRWNSASGRGKRRVRGRPDTDALVAAACSTVGASGPSATIPAQRRHPAALLALCAGQMSASPCACRETGLAGRKYASLGTRRD